jgi:hypothetical protein
MKRKVAPVLLSSLLALSACGATHLAVAPPVSEGQLTQTRDEFRRGHPDSRVGLVTEVLAGAPLASVGSITPSDFSPGDVITFLDSNRQTLTLGYVEKINPDSITVRFSDPTSAGRVPVPGDMAVRFVH